MCIYLNNPLAKREQERSQLVVKSNALIRKSRYKLNTTEQKILLYLISKVQPTDTGFEEYYFDLKQFAQICGIEINGSGELQHFKNTIQSLSDKSFWVENEEKTSLCRWVQKAEIIKNESKILIQLDRFLIPYLLQLKESFTSYQLVNVLLMKSKYSIRLFEILKSYEKMRTYTAEVTELKELLNTPENYNKYFNKFKVKVLDVALKEINTYTELEVKYSFKKNGAKITHIVFSIGRKNREEQYITQFENTEKLEKTDLSFYKNLFKSTGSGTD